MKISTCPVEEQLKIEWKCHIIKGKKRIKYAKNGTKVIEYITENQDKLTPSLYALADEIYLTKNSAKHFAYVMKNYKYQTLQQQITRINKKEVLLTINKIVNELLSIDVVYWDIHTNNFLVKGKKVVAIDLDEAKKGIDPSRLQNARYNYLDLIIHLYLCASLDQKMNFINNFMERINIDDYFSKEVCEYFNDIYWYCGEQIRRDPSFVIPEFEDEEKIKYLAKNM